MEDYNKLSEEIKGKLIEELEIDLDKLNVSRDRIQGIMDAMVQHKVPNMDSHNFMIETIRTQLEVSLDNLDNAIYQSKEILDSLG